MQRLHRTRRLTALFVTGLLTPLPATAGMVFVSNASYLETDLSIPSIRIEAGGTGTVQIAIDPTIGLSQPNQAIGARFRLDNVPDGWTVSVLSAPNALCISLGNHAFDIQFTECQSMSNDRLIVLGELTFVATPESPVENHRIHFIATESGFPNHPRVRLCDSTLLHVPSGQLVINPPLALHGVTWSTVKQLYEP
jgi:hypothetical protein